MKNSTEIPPSHLMCFSHLRWDFVFQRPQQILTRLAKNTTIYYYEEPLFEKISESYLTISKERKNISVITPHLSSALSAAERTRIQQALLEQFFTGADLQRWTFWYYTPMALPFTSKFKPRLLVYDCMDELSAFDFAPPEMLEMEKKLMGKADLVFTGGRTLFQAKRKYHNNCCAFPSSIDQAHFEKAKFISAAPEDQAKIHGPKIGYFGVIDERFDRELIQAIAEQRPSWQLILIGPVVKISPDSLPRRANIHYLGSKSYLELPAYLSKWDVALIPFYLNRSTEFISPTKTPEYLAAGVPVVSTAIKDVVNPYGLKGLAHIGKTADDFIAAIEKELNEPENKQWEDRVSSFLAGNSWDKTVAAMQRQMRQTLKQIREVSVAS